MARKETYRLRYTNQLGKAGEMAPKQPRTPRPPINPSIQAPFLEGRVVVIDKPLHWTSFDVVRKMRSILQIKKIGHAGTLDPLATGLLIVCTGKFTRKINEFMAAEKEYTGHIVLGATTPTYDLESTPGNFTNFSYLQPGDLQATAVRFTGTIQQYPPVYSAIKKDGVALYELARRGAEVALEPRTITIHHFEITGVELPAVHFRVVCSTGTYIRSLANDFGAALGCGGYLGSLRRTRIGETDLSAAMTMEQFESLVQVPAAE